MKENYFKHLAFIYLLMIFVITVCACQDCEEIRNEAKALKAKYQKCEMGDSCIIVDPAGFVGSNNCLGPFQCPASMNENDIDKFKSKAKELAQDFERCRECAQAGCVSIDTYVPYCNEETGLCDAEMVSSGETLQ